MFLLPFIGRNFCAFSGCGQGKKRTEIFSLQKPKQVKFIDRTFNSRPERAYEIFKYLIDNDNGVTNFHFEICADLLDDRTLCLLSMARKGLFQMEIGIQSANPATLTAIGRRDNIYPVLYNTERLIKLGNIHTHVDLIAGLPYESYGIFARSFDKVYDLKADMLQLGFLKVLCGTPIYNQIEAHNIKYRKHAPYEVISTAYISAEELVRLKMIENMVDVYYNRGGFGSTLDFLIKASDMGAFGFYEKLADFYYEKGFQNRERKKEDQYRILLEFAGDLERSSREDLKKKTQELLEQDMRANTNPEIFNRFMKKGWKLT